MPIHVSINDNQLVNFSDEAKDTLNQQVSKYIINVIKEANLIEEGNRENGASREITSNIILNAVQRHKNYIKRRPSKFLIATKIISPIFLLLCGFLFDPSGYQDNLGKLLLFIFCLIIACISVAIQSFKE